MWSMVVIMRDLTNWIAKPVSRIISEAFLNIQLEADVAKTV